MKNLNIVKAANLIAVFVMVFVLVVPFFAGAQFSVPTPAAGSNVPTQSSATALILYVIQILLALAGLVAVVFLIIGGFRYILAGGNEEAAESAKKTITNAIIGIVIIILAFVIIRVIANALLTGTP